MAATNLVLHDQDVLLVVDMQNDFVTGALAVPGAASILPAVNRLLSRFRHVVLIQDWHPPNHVSFASNYPDKKPGDEIALHYGSQFLWPDHCVQGSAGADFVEGLNAARAELVLRKGYNTNIDSYSALFENDRKTPTGLAGYLRERGLSRLFIAGLALDFCVRYSAEDARNSGFDVVVIDDACAAIDLESSLAATRMLFSNLKISVAGESSIAFRY
jgi:nicotinamidase/pyrazinamidase